MFEILKMKFDQDLCATCDMNSTLGSVVPLAMFWQYFTHFRIRMTFWISLKIPLEPVNCVCQKFLSILQDIFRSPAQWTLCILQKALQESHHHMVWNILIKIGKFVHSDIYISIVIVQVMVQNLNQQLIWKFDSSLFGMGHFIFTHVD